jgi:2-methylcitrate dehydratase PrpD
MSAPSQQMLDYVTSLTEADLTPQITQGAIGALLDNLGCGLYGARQPWGAILSEFVTGEGARGRATLYGSRDPVSPVRAAFANGTATHGFELDDIILGALAHPGAVVVPAALAAAEQYRASGSRLLLGIVAGYEVMARVAAALGSDHNNRGFHTTSVAGPVASTVAAGIVMDLKMETLQNAIGIACSSASGIKAFTQGTGGMVKRTHAGRASEAGVLACELASRGFSGPLQAIDGKFGLLEVFGGRDVHLECLTQMLEGVPAITRIWVKVYPCCGLIHTTAHALEKMKREHRINPAEVKGVRVRSSKRAVIQNGGRDASDTMSAQYSIPFCAGVALAADARDPASFAPENLGNREVHRIADATQLEVDAGMEALYPAHFAAHVDVELKDGRKFTESVIDAHGTPADPVTLADLERKFCGMAAACMTKSALNDVIISVRTLPAAGNVEALSHALRAVTPPVVAASIAA